MAQQQSSRITTVHDGVTYELFRRPVSLGGAVRLEESLLGMKLQMGKDFRIFFPKAHITTYRVFLRLGLRKEVEKAIRKEEP